MGEPFRLVRIRARDRAQARVQIISHRSLSDTARVAVVAVAVAVAFAIAIALTVSLHLIYLYTADRAVYRAHGLLAGDNELRSFAAADAPRVRPTPPPERRALAAMGCVPHKRERPIARPLRRRSAPGE